MSERQTRWWRELSSCNMSIEDILLHLLALKHSKIKDIVHIDFKWLMHSRTRRWNNVFIWRKLLWSYLAFFPWKFLIQALFYCHVSFNNCICMLPNVCPVPGGILFDWASFWCSPSRYWHSSIKCDPIVRHHVFEYPRSLWFMDYYFFSDCFPCSMPFLLWSIKLISWMAVL